jgi:hypothetical protein
MFAWKAQTYEDIHIYIHTYTCTNIHIYICTHYIHTYIHRGQIWHRNKLSSSQMEPLVRCSNDQHQTSLKWDRSSHPVATECRVSHTLRLKHWWMNDLRSPCYSLICWNFLLTLQSAFLDGQCVFFLTCRVSWVPNQQIRSTSVVYVI